MPHTPPPWPPAFFAGFEFQHFEFGEREALLRDFPHAAPWIERLMAD